MILQVKIINGVRKLVPLTTDSGQGLPLGAITAFYGTTAPTGYLICDGSSFDASVYPALAALLGGNTLPDLRECVLVGVGTNDTDTIADHDVYTLGEFKDDQLQNHTHSYTIPNGSGGGGQPSGTAWTNNTYTKQTASMQGRGGDTTHGKQKGVNYIIKAVIGPIESAEADQVVQTIKQNLIKTIELRITSQRDGYYWQDLPVDTSKILNVQVLSAHSTNAAVVLCRDSVGAKTGLKFFSPTNYASINGTFTVLIVYLDN